LSLAKAALGSISSTLIGNILLLLTGVLTARLLGPEGKGLYVFAFLIPQLAVNVLSLGVGSAGAYFIARGEQGAGPALGTALAIVLPLGLASSFALEVVVRGGAWRSPGAPYVALAGWSIVPTMSYALVRHTLLGLQRYERFNILNVLDKLVLLLCLVAGVLAGRTDALALCRLNVAASFAAAGLGFLLLPRDVLAHLSITPTFAGRVLSYGLRGHVGWLAELLNYRLDMLFVSALAGATELGLYSAAVSLAETLWLVPSCVSVIMMPRLAGSRSDPTSTTATVCRLVVPLTATGAVVAGVLGGFLLRLLYGAAFAPARLPFNLLLPGVAAYALVRILSADFGARGRPGVASVVSWISLAVTVALDLTLIGRHGASGAAFASTAAYLTSTVVAVAVYHRLTALPVGRLLVPRQPDRALAIEACRRLWRDSVGRRSDAATGGP